MISIAGVLPIQKTKIVARIKKHLFISVQKTNLTMVQSRSKRKLHSTEINEKSLSKKKKTEPYEKTLLIKKSKFNSRIVVLDTQLEKNGPIWRELQFGYKQLAQGRVRMTENGELDHTGRCGYIDSMAAAGIAFLKAFRPLRTKVFANQTKIRLLFVGLGVGALPNIFINSFPNVVIDVVDIDPVVVEVAKNYFGFDADKVNLFVEDIGNFLMKTGKNYKYDAIFLDVADENGLPRKLFTQNFVDRISNALVGKTSVLITNAFYQKKKDFHDILQLFEKSFQSVHWLGCEECADNYIVVSYQSDPISESGIINGNKNIKETFDFDFWEVLEYGIENGSDY